MAKFEKFTFQAEPFFRNSAGEDLALEVTDREANGIFLAITGLDGKRDFIPLSIEQAEELVECIGDAVQVMYDDRKKKDKKSK